MVAGFIKPDLLVIDDFAVLAMDAARWLGGRHAGGAASRALLQSATPPEFSMSKMSTGISPRSGQFLAPIGSIANLKRVWWSVLLDA